MDLGTPALRITVCMSLLLPVTAHAACKFERLLDMPVTMRGARPVVEAKVNGADTQFIVESGAFYSFISPAKAAELGLRTEMPKNPVLVEGVGGAQHVMVTTVKELTLGGGISRDVQFAVGGSDPGRDMAGYFGQNILSFADTDYNLGGGFIRLLRAMNCSDAEKVYWGKDGQSFSVITVEPMTQQQPHIRGTALLNGSKIRVMFDTGAAISVLTERAAKRAGVKTQGEGVVSAGAVRGAGMRQVETVIVPVESFRIGEEEIRSTKLRVADIEFGGTDMLLGADFFLSHRVYVSGSSRKVIFTYNGGPVFDLSTGPARSAAAGPAITATPQAASAAPADQQLDARGYSRRGAVLAARGDYPGAIQDLTRACELAPAEPEYFLQRGRLFLANRQPRLALEDFDQVLKLNPDHAPALVARANLLIARREAQAGGGGDPVADLGRASALLTREDDMHLEIGELYLRAGAYPAAITELDLWLDRHGADNSTADAFASRCRARGLMGQELDKALADCNRAARDRRDTPFVFDSRGMVQLRLRNYDKAIQDYDTVLRAQPRNPWALYGRGLSLLAKGRTAEGEANIAAAKASNPRIVAEAVRLGLVP